MTSYATSADGTRIAFDRLGAGDPVVVVVGGILCDRRTTAPLAAELARQCTVLNVDRRGRGDSGNAPSYAPEREIEDVAAVAATAGGATVLYGHSSGAGLALEAAASGVPIRRLVLHEPPYGGGDAESAAAARALAEGISDALRDGRPADAIRLFMADSGLPAEDVDAMAEDAGTLALAPTMLHDLLLMGELDGGAIPAARVGAVTVPTLVLAGSTSPPFFLDTARRIAELLPDGDLSILDGFDHGAPPEAVAPVVTAFAVG